MPIYVAKLRKINTYDFTLIVQDGRHEKRTLRLRNGLITRHAYSVTGLARVRGQLGKYDLKNV